MKIFKVHTLLLVNILCFVSVNVKSQNFFNNVYNDFEYTFSNTISGITYYNNEYGRSVINTLDNNYLSICNAESNNFLGDDSAYVYIFLVKLEPNGDTIWTKRIDINNYGIEAAWSPYLCEDSSILLCGFITDTLFNNFNTIDGLILKIDKNGDYLWHKRYDFGGDHKFLVLKTNDNGQTFNLLSFAEVSDTSTEYDIFYTTIDENGNLLSNYQIGGYDWDIGRDFEYLNDGTILIAGETYTNAAGTLNRTDVYLLNIDTSGNILWEKRYGYPGWDETESNQCLYVDYQMDECYIAASHEKQNGNIVAWLLKTDLNGDTLWSKMYDKGQYYDDFKSILPWTDGNLIIMGSTREYNQPTPRPIAWLIKMDKDGNIIWERNITKYFGQPNADDYPSEMSISNDGSILLTGYIINSSIETDSVFHRNDAWLVKTDSCGFTVGDQPQALFNIDSINNSGTIFINNLSSEYCTGRFRISPFNGPIIDNFDVYAYSHFTKNPTDPFDLQYTFCDTGWHIISLTVKAGDSTDTYAQSIYVPNVDTLQEHCNDSINDTTSLTNLPYGYFKVLLYPNPTKNNIIIQLSESSSTICQGTIYTMDGRKVHDFTIPANLLQSKIELPELQAGVYLVKISDDSGRSAVSKITIME